jgi:alpha-glucosidase (family GH31 glycosyl hydrolase)
MKAKKLLRGRGFSLYLIFIFVTPIIAFSHTEEIVGNVRVQVLSPTLVRIELKGPKGFEDRETFHITERTWPGASVTRSTSGGFECIETSDFIVKVPSNGQSLDGIVITEPNGTELWAMPSTTYTYATIKCRWTGGGNAYLYDDNAGVVRYGSNPNNDSYYWLLESDNGYTQIRNKATGHYMNIENNLDYVECTPVESHWESKDWAFEDVDGFKRIRCRWGDYPDYIHIEYLQGYAEHAPAGTTNPNGHDIGQWWSAMWHFEITDSFLTNRVWIPHPHSNTEAWAFCDTPRYVPANWGYNLAPPGSPDYHVNGWDLDNDAPDVFVFLPKGDGRKLRNEYLKLTGRTELIPLYALGGWDSRYYAYTQQQALDKIDTYRSRNIPLDVFVLDTDWRVGASHGYQVNTTLFPDMAGFISTAHDKHVRIVFNDHPEPQADALDPIEVEYRNNGLRGKFDIGLDVWWYDRNWHTHLIPPSGINKEVFGMYIYHWITQDYDPNRRPFIMANVDGIDNGYINRPPNIAAHRYNMQWTGDTPCDFASLEREVRNAVYSGVFAPFAYVSADLGGHWGTPTTEQYCRWVQYGALSPIFRLHCTQGTTRDPWAYAAPAEYVVRKYVQMRMRLLPVFYTAARKNYDSGEPILRRCDLDYPNHPEAERNDQYLLGKGILVAPIITAGNSRTVWIPPGNWICQCTGDIISGPQVITSTVLSVEQMPIFVKEGTIVPLAPDMQYSGEKAWSPINLDVYPSINYLASATLYEDDTITNKYKDGAYRKTNFTAGADDYDKNIIVEIMPAQGTYDGALSSRSWVVRVRRAIEWPSDYAVHSVTVDGYSISDFEIKTRNPNAMPFSNQGGSPDSEVIEIALPSKPVNTPRTVIIYFTTYDIRDLALFCLHWLDIDCNDSEGDETDWCFGNDMDHSGTVDFMDFTMLASRWRPLIFRATNPYPPDEADFVDPNIVLSWSPGATADLHLIYFGDSFDNVNNADPYSPEYRSVESQTSWDPCDTDPLPFEKSFFWRIDEYDYDSTTIYKGEIWSFRTTTTPSPPP